MARHGRQPSIFDVLEKRAHERLDWANERRRRILAEERAGVDPEQVEDLEYATELVSAQRDAAQQLLWELRRTKPRADRVDRLHAEFVRLEQECQAAVASGG